ncbi:Sua5/YciO/YrdC/YwlC family protein [Mycoplasma marinum]|uniref:L-threonylcarbamoyladenylate synthase n=1 Tax=Mycoplasma marinum TaxID=1937190 RepID=A0A4R0XR05_9MOLU|nr:Sua5/YciO/YrdC/YwlC family protein [Mycoplasma marinum]TCG10810.1 SUA5-like translation suppressor [Mycoplasma marinum]
MKQYTNIFISTTDTVVGIGAPMSKENEQKLFSIKNRPSNKPLLVMVSSIEEARKFEGWNNNAEKLAQKYWPGQVTIIIGEIGIRIPNNKQLIELIKIKGPIYMTSANKSGDPTLDLEEAKKTFPEIKEVYDFGVGSKVASTIVRASDFKIFRQGSIKIEK